MVRQVWSFVAIGIVCTVVWAALYSTLRHAWTPVLANGVALVLTAIGNTAVNRRFTFGVEGRDGLARDHGIGLLAFLLALALTTGAPTVLGIVAPHAGRPVELAVLIGANAIATAGRFVLLRTWLGRRSFATG